MSGERVTIGVQVEGTEKAKQDIGSLADSLSTIYSNLNVPQSGGASSKPAGSAAIVPTISDGLGSYNAPLNASQSGLNLGGMSGTLAPAMSFVTQANPNIIPKAPSAFGTGGNYGPPPVIPGGGSSQGGGFGGGVLQVQIVGSVPLTFANGGGAGTGGGGGQGGSGGGSTGGGGFGGGNGGGGGGANPYAAGFNPHGTGGVSGFLADIKANPSLGGVAQAGVSALSKASPAFAAALGPVGLAFGAMKAIAEPILGATDIYYASQAPAYQMNTDFIARNIRGDYISDTERRDRPKIASAQGALDAYKTLNQSTLGRIANFASLGISDDVMNRNIVPRFEREIAEKNAQMSADLQINRLTNMVGSQVGALSGANLVTSTAMASGALRFGSRGLRGLMESDFTDLAEKGWSGDQINGMVGTIQGVASSQQSGNLYGQLAGGANVRGMATASLPGLIAKGDIDGINSLRPQIGKSAADAAVTQARGTFQLGVTSQIDQSKFSSAGSQVSLLGATGAGYRQIAGAIGTQSNTLDAVKSDLQKQMGLAAAAGNTADVASLGAQINQINAQQAQMHQQQAMTIFTGRGVDNQALSAGASNAMYRSMYTGTQADVDKAFGSQSRAGLAEANRLEDMSKSPFISPEQRALYKQQAIQQRQQATIGVDRDRSSYDYGITQGKIGVRDARADQVVMRSRLFGDQESDYAGALGKSNITAAQLNAVNSRLNDPKAHLSETERLDLQRQQIQLQTDLNRSLEEAKRSLLGMRVATDQAQSSIVHMGNSVQMQFFGAGGQVAGANQVGEIGANRKTLGAAQSNFDYYDKMVKSGKMSASNPDYLKAKQGVISAQGDLYGSESALATLPGSLSSRNQLLDSQFAMQMGSKTFLPFGNMRGNLEHGMGAIGSQLKDLDANEKRAIGEANRDTYKSEAEKQARLGQISYDFKQQRYGLNGQLADMQQQLQQGWMDRLISSQVNAPSRTAFVASQFTMHEAAPFLQNTDLYNGSFGFGGKDGAKGRDDIMFKYARYMGGMSIGNITRPEGFLDTAMSGAHAGVGVSPLVGGAGGYASAGGAAVSAMTPAQRLALARHDPNARMLMPGADWDGGQLGKMSGTLKAADTTIRIILEDHRTTVISGGKTQTVNHPGGNASHIQSLNNGALTQSGSVHNLTGGSHQ